MVTTPAVSTRPVRPVGATVVTGVAVAAALYLFWKGADILRDADGDQWEVAHGLLQVGLGLLALAVGIGAMRTRPWAWALFMAWAVVGLTSQILRHFSFDDADYVAMTLFVVAVFALTPRDVQVAFQIREPANIQLDKRTRNPLDRD